MSDNTYAAAGVSIEEGDRAVELFAPHAKRATRPEVLGGLGGFAGLFKLGVGLQGKRHNVFNCCVS